MATYSELLPRFIRYAKENTRSDEKYSDQVPSTQRQVVFLESLEKELNTIGLSDVKLNKDNYYLTALIPSNIDKKAPVMGFITHIDTADFNSENVNPQIVENYDGESIIKLDEKGDFVLDPKEFPALKNYKGNTLVTTDGSTLLGADDKSGVASVITFAEHLVKNPDIKHGDIKLAFGPDEEIGMGATRFDVKDFGADFAYTVDGGPLGQLEYETFSAASLKVTVKGKNVHPGSAYGVMKNSISIGIEFQDALPQEEVPELTKGREGFYHLLSFEGTVEESHLDYILRDFDEDKLQERKDTAEKVAAQLNEKYGKGTVIIEIRDSYKNMYEIMKDHMDVVKLAEDAMNNLDIEPLEEPVRGGTDGSTISFMGLPTPNLFAGGENMHGRYEYVSLQTMEKVVDLLLEINKLNIK